MMSRSVFILFFLMLFQLSAFSQEEVISNEELMKGKLKGMMQSQSLDEALLEEKALNNLLLAAGGGEEAGEAVLSIFAGGVVSEVEDKVKIAIAASLDVTTALYVEEQARKAKVEIEKREEEKKQIKKDRAIVGTTTGIYEGYKTILSYIEEISEVYQTFTYAKQVYKDIEKAAEAYQRVSLYGVVHIHTLYDLEKWLNPDEKKFKNNYLKFYIDRLENITELVKKILLPVKEGGFRAGDSWRMRKLEELDLEIRSLIAGIYRMHRWCMARARANREIHLGIIVDKACWDFNSYHYQQSYSRVDVDGFKTMYDINN